MNVETEEPASTTTHVHAFGLHSSSLWQILPKLKKNKVISTCCTSLTVCNNFQQLYAGILYLKKVKEIKRIGLSHVRLTSRSSKCYIISQSNSVKLNRHSHTNPIFMMLEDLLETPSSISSWQLHSSTVWGALILIETNLYFCDNWKNRENFSCAIFKSSQ